MSQVSPVLRRATGRYFHWCPACEMMHPLPDTWPVLKLPQDVSEEITRLKSVPTDADIAAELRAEIAPHVLGICKVMEKSLALGMQISFTMNPDSFGRYIPPFISITKAL